MIPAGFLLILELIGTVAFAVSGAIVAIKKKMDIFGVAALAVTTAVGGGVIRDVILNVSPPVAFAKPVYFLLAVGISIVAFLPPIRKHLHENDIVLLVMDSLGLGVFTMVGVRAGMNADVTNRFLAVFVGAITGVGGGIMRDIFAGMTPSIFVRHFYAMASICGAVLCVLLWPCGELSAMLSGAVLVFVLRILAAKMKWHLPKA